MESSRNFIKNQVWDPKRAKLVQKSYGKFTEVYGTSKTCPGGPIRAHMDPYGPIYGPIWVHMGPYGSSWTGLGSSVNFRKLSVRLLDQFRTFRVPNLVFDEISR